MVTFVNGTRKTHHNNGISDIFVNKVEAQEARLIFNWRPNKEAKIRLKKLTLRLEGSIYEINFKRSHTCKKKVVSKSKLKNNRVREGWNFYDKDWNCKN